MFEAAVAVILILIALIIILFNKYMSYRNRAAQDVRAAALNMEELEKHGREVASEHTISSRLRPSYRLLPRMEDNYRFIIRTYKELNEDVKGRRGVVPAAEWLFDNFYVIEEQVKEIRINFPRGYYGALPTLTNGILRGFPRVYGIALELVSHTDGKIDEKTLINFIKSYQTNSQLTSGELWAVPLILRISLIENIRYTCQELAESREQREKADKLADMILSEREVSGDRLFVNLDEFTREMDNIGPAFTEHLMDRLRKSGTEIESIVSLFDEKLASQDTNVEDIINLEHQELAKQQVSMGNSITSLRLISSLDWENIFELLSPVEQVLRKDPAGIYSRMDFRSRDYYRHKAEEMAKSLRISESKVAKKAIECAKNAQGDDIKSHVGYYLAGGGRGTLESLIGYRPRPGQGFKRFMKKHPLFAYLLPIFLITVGITYVLTAYAYNKLDANTVMAVITALVVLLPSSEIGVGIVNWAVTHMLEPSFLPKLEFKEGVPEECSSMVVIPTLLPNEARVEELLEQLEVYYLGNQESNLYFVLLGDFMDGSSKDMPGDDLIVKAALDGIRKLNKKYSNGEKDIFYFFHRSREFNPSMGVWMGWERKRGKLLEFNRLLRGSNKTGYYIKSGDLSLIPPIKYVITLDADTELPRGAARKLIGTIYHPLNRAAADDSKSRVVEGYGILQPRIGIGINAVTKTRFSKIFAGQGGIDPYTTAVSDVYQDLFNEGIFTGKGIYDVDIFISKLDESIPENRVLSHDLLEGSYVRAGLVTDIEFVDGFPSKYSSYMARLHRWVRGDWQLLPYLAPMVKNSSGRAVRNPLSLISRWKILDNMRRSLVPPSIMLLIVLGIFILPGPGILWFGPAALAIALPIFTGMVDALFDRDSLGSSSNGIWSGIENIIYQIVLMFIFLPYKAYIMLDAVVRTLNRLLFTKKNLLEWVTAADAEKMLKNDARCYFKRMWISPAAGVILTGAALYYSPRYWLLTGAVSVLWVLSPYIAYLVSSPAEDKIEALSNEDIYELRRIARKTWRYFEDFAGPGENYLPPDNYQEDPPRGAAHRTSSTNIGLLLTSTLAARDMGYISTTGLIERLENTFASLERLDKWKGHLYNWYDTVTLQPLRPLYISTVDSGNLVGYFMTLRVGLDELVKKPLIDKSLLNGLIDTYKLLDEGLSGSDGSHEPKIDISMLIKLLEDSQIDIVKWNSILDTLKEDKEKLNKEGILDDSPWSQKVDSMLFEFKKEILDTYKWMMLPAMPDELNHRSGSGNPASKVNSLINIFKKNLSLEDLSQAYKDALSELNGIMSCEEDTDIYEWLKESKSLVMKSYLCVNRYISRVKVLAEKCSGFARDTQFKPLFDEKRQLFSIGYSAEDEQLNRSYYDLLASEARQTSFIAIAKGDIREEHWFRLGRPLVTSGKHRGLASWSGTMFEYLMPLLIMKNYKNTLLDQTYKFVITAQRDYGIRRNVPWGVSESGYYAFDIALNYQYRAFGVPRLGLKRGLVNDMVVAPYSTLLALMVDHVSAMKNIYSLKAEGMEGLHGFYEAIDYTPGRLPADKKSVIVKSYMAHHHGMSMMALDNFLNSNIMQERFHTDPVVKSAELLLQERVPDRIILTKDIEGEVSPLERVEKVEENRPRIIKSAPSDFPESHIISNGSYSVVLNNHGTGFSKFQGIAVTRWREDTTLNTSGMFFYIRNVNSNMIWSSAYMPCKVMPEQYNVIFSSEKVEYQRVDGSIDTHTEIAVSPEDNVEVRRISLTNHAGHGRVIEVTSFFEAVISHQSADAAHPAFNNLFVKTEFVPGIDTLLGTRRPRSADQRRVWLVHTVTAEGEVVGGVQYETDRFKFIGRNRDVSNPEAMDIDHPLSGTVGAVLDPVMSMRKRVRIQPGKTVRLSYITGIADSREDALALAHKYHDESSINRVFELAWTRGQVEQRYLDIRERDMELYQKLLSHILYMSPLRRLREDILRRNIKGQSGLWPYGISGDLPIILVSVKRSDEVDIVHEALKVHEYWRINGFAVDLVVLNEYEGDYIQSLQNVLSDIISCSHGWEMRDRPGGVFLRQSNVMSDEERVLLYTSARIVLKGDGGPIGKQIKLMEEDKTIPHEKEYKNKPYVYPENREVNEKLIYYNDIGGFNSDGSEYVIHLKERQRTPAPWSNIISNEKFGFLVTESGGGYTWAENSRENKLTPWSNDPVSDPPGEIIYIRDEDAGKYWSIAPSPVRESSSYTIRHGFGYSVFGHTSHGIKQEMTVFTPREDSIKIYRIRLKNISGISREISLIFYIRPVLGVTDQITSPYIVTEVDEKLGAMLIRNTYSDDFPGRIAYISCSEDIHSYTGSREEFIGRNRSLTEPAALSREGLSNTVGAGFDPCGALMAVVNLNVDEEKEVVFTLGQELNAEAAVSTALKYRDVFSVDKALSEVKDYWKNLLGTVVVNTPDASLNILANGWLLYQTICCRIWGRSAFYQSGGAFGFRDQLQDVMAAVYVCPGITKDQILINSSHQFIEGDVQHWWHPVTDKGIRTKFSDDLLWLPYVVADYIEVTGDYSILDMEASFLEDEPLGEHEDERYNKPRVSTEKAAIYEHCIRAIERSLRFGEHGIPLMGSGDWNDGMNTVGNKGRGESVWLGWFLYSILVRFAPICTSRGDEKKAEEYLKTANNIIDSIEKNAWDGSWYRRAYFDDGTPLGSASNTECQIDSLSQSWPAITGAGRPYRVEEAMGALEHYLIRRDDGLIMLLNPPFDSSELEPGYIKSYVPGVRENGGQYTHAAVWVVMAFARMGKGDEAWELYNMINPINHTNTMKEYLRYKVEPYVMAADVYTVEPHTGRGGWTWYTGAAGWMYRVCVEHLLGLKIRGENLLIEPCIPKRWSQYSIGYRYKNTYYNITIKNPSGVNTGVKCIYIDGALLKENKVPLKDDGRAHSVDVMMG